jgi:peptide/nickel transport system substrate-binding protein
MEVIYTLRPGLRWHDGQPLTAEDIQFTWMAHTDPRHVYPPTPGYEQIRTVEVVDARTARVVFFRTYPEYYALFQQVLPKHSFRSRFWQFSPEHPWNRHPVGSGPFVLKEWKRGESALLDPNPLYHRARPHLDQIRYQFKVADFRAFPAVVEWAQSADIIQGMSIISYDYLREHPDLSLHLRTTGKIEHLNINLKHPVLANLRVRRALARAIDRKLVRERLLGLAEPAWSDQARDSWKYNARSEAFYPFDPTQAGALLDAAGWKARGDGQRYNDQNEPLQFSLILEAGNQSHQVIGAYLKQAFAQIGVGLELKPVPTDMLLREVLPGGHYELALAAWNRHPRETSFRRWHSSQVPPQGFNYGGFQDYQADDLLEAMAASPDLSRQKQLYQQLAEVLNERLPAIPLYYDTLLEANRKSVHNYLPNSFGGSTWNCASWWLE